MLKKTGGRWLLLPLLALVPLSSAQAAGTREGGLQGHDVVIDKKPTNTTNTASGALGTARLEPLANTEKGIGCHVDAAAASVLVRCDAWLQLNTGDILSLSCYSELPTFISAVAAMNGDSKISFTQNPGDGTCTSLVVDNDSMYQQKVN